MALTAEEKTAAETRLALLEGARDKLLSGQQQVKVRYEDWEVSYSASDPNMYGRLNSAIDNLKRCLGRGHPRSAGVRFR